MIPSPKVPTYDQQPEMSVQAVADKVSEVVKSDEFDFVMANFAPPDMVGHTGVYEAAVKAITATDKAVKTIAEACKEAGYTFVSDSFTKRLFSSPSSADHSDTDWLSLFSDLLATSSFVYAWTFANEQCFPTDYHGRPRKRRSDDQRRRRTPHFAHYKPRPAHHRRRRLQAQDG